MNKEEGLELFLDNAFLFLEHKDRILSDKKMFFCPVPIQSGLAYCGTGGFEHPTLGVYIEWWLACDSALVYKDDDTQWLVYRISGSPLSGCNNCGIVNEEGITDRAAIPSFLPSFTSFTKINNRYKAAKSQCEAYTLEEVVDVFRQEGLSKREDKDLRIRFLKNAMQRQRADMDLQKELLLYRISCLKHQLMVVNRTELELFMKEHKEREVETTRKEREIIATMTELRRKLKSGELRQQEFQKQFTPLKKEKRRIARQLNSFRWETFDRLFPEIDISLEEIEWFLENNKTDMPAPFRRPGMAFHSPEHNILRIAKTK